MAHAHPRASSGFPKRGFAKRLRPRLLHFLRVDGQPSSRRRWRTVHLRGPDVGAVYRWVAVRSSGHRGHRHFGTDEYLVNTTPCTTHHGTSVKWKKEDWLHGNAVR